MAAIYGKAHQDYYGYWRGDYIDADDGVTNGADVIIGTNFKDTIYGLGGNDVLKGVGGADNPYGGAGDDTLNRDGIGDFLDGGSGNDTANFADAQYGVYVNLAAGYYN